MAAILNNRPTIGKLFNSVVQWAEGKKGIVYAINIDHARDIAAYYAEKGMRAVAIDSKTPSKDREQYAQDFKEGKLNFIVNVRHIQ